MATPKPPMNAVQADQAANKPLPKPPVKVGQPLPSNRGNDQYTYNFHAPNLTKPSGAYSPAQIEQSRPDPTPRAQPFISTPPPVPPVGGSYNVNNYAPPPGSSFNLPQPPPPQGSVGGGGMQFKPMGASVVPQSSAPLDPMAQANATNYMPGHQSYVPKPPAVQNTQIGPRVSNWQFYNPSATNVPLAGMFPPMAGYQPGLLNSPPQNSGAGTPPYSLNPYGSAAAAEGSIGAAATNTPLVQNDYYNPNTSGYGSYEGANFNPYGNVSPGGQYTVQPGDSLAAIAQRLGVDYGQLVTLNNLWGNPDLIQPGQQLILPGGGISQEAFAAQAGVDPYLAAQAQQKYAAMNGGVWTGYGQAGWPAPAAAPAPNAPMGGAPAAAVPVPPPMPVDSDLAGLLDLFAVVQPGQIFEIPPAWQERLFRSGLGAQFNQLLSSMGFQAIGDMGMFGFNSDYVKPAQFTITPETQALIGQLPPEWRAAMGQFVMAMVAQAPGAGAPVPPVPPAAAPPIEPPVPPVEPPIG